MPDNYCHGLGAIGSFSSSCVQLPKGSGRSKTYGSLRQLTPRNSRSKMSHLEDRPADALCPLLIRKQKESRRIIFLQHPKNGMEWNAITKQRSKDVKVLNPSALAPGIPKEGIAKHRIETVDCC
jgi:hypothetical protein